MPRLIRISGISVFCLALSLAVAACSEDRPSGGTTGVESPEKTNTEVRFESDVLKEEYGAEVSAVWLTIGAERVFIAEASGVTSGPSPYAPDDALSSLVAWWGGGGPQFYASQDGSGVLQVFQGWDDEARSADDEFEWDLIRTVDVGSEPIDIWPVSQCAPSERSYFSCALQDNGELASLCGSVIQTDSEGYLQFRIGIPGQEVLRFPEELTGSKDHFQWESMMYSGGWDTRVQFFQDGMEYQLFDRAIKVSMSEKDFSAGLMMPEEDQVRECVALDAIYLNALPNVIQMGSFIDL
jgi:hypothetical protein